MQRALNTGIAGQDGSYLAELLLSKGYEVHGIVRRASSFNTGRLDGIYRDPHEPGPRLQLHYGDLTDSVALVNLIRAIAPHEVYHLGAQSHVKVSFEIPEYTGGVDRSRRHPAAGSDPCLRCRDPLLPGVVIGDVRVGAAAAGRADAISSPQPLRLRQGLRLLDDDQLPGGLRPLRGQWHPLQPREPRRGETFVTRKVTRAVARDWGYAPEYVEAMWRMLQQDLPDVAQDGRPVHEVTLVRPARPVHAFPAPTTLNPAPNDTGPGSQGAGASTST